MTDCRAHITIELHPLKSGYSPDIGGQITVSFSGLRPRQVLVFKALDTGVKCSSLSSAKLS